MGLLGKLLLTAVVIAGVLLYLRYRNEQALSRPKPMPRVVNPPPSPRRAGPAIGWLASGVVVVAILGVGVWLYGYWQDRNQVLYVRVVDAGTGHVTGYRAYRGDIGDREFMTVDGTRVRLAETERLETTTIPPARD